MKLHFLGANRQVTGSRYCLEVAEQRILIDCGMFQERQFVSRNWETSPIPASELDALVLSHAHLDHCGLIPRLVDAGFHGPIYCTRPTVDLARIIMTDSAKIQEEDAAYKRRRHAKEGRRGAHPPAPLYTAESVEKAMRPFHAQPYGTRVRVTDNVDVMFHDAGHILGSAMLELTVTEEGRPRQLVFSGDIGQHGKPFIRDPSQLEHADYVVLESTYGDRFHEKGGDIETELADVINKTVDRGGNVVVPTFAVERAQELVYYLSRLVHDDRIPDIKIFLDSPMAVDVTDLFSKYQDCFDQETWGLILAQEPPLRFPGLHLVRSVSESKAINQVGEPCVIMASSGMCTGGRIKHHLRQNVERSASTVLFVGYQADGTLGRQIRNRCPEIRIHGRQYRMRAEVAEINGFSGHADRAGLLEWISGFQEPPRRVFLTHGDEEAAQSLATEIEKQLDFRVNIPEYIRRTTLSTESRWACRHSSGSTVSALLAITEMVDGSSIDAQPKAPTSIEPAAVGWTLNETLTSTCYHANAAASRPYHQRLWPPPRAQRGLAIGRFRYHRTARAKRSGKVHLDQGRTGAGRSDQWNW
jgi:metallo-beta-lactamase family protein